MTPPENDVLNFIKDFVWAPLLALVGWAWHRNEQEHQAIRAAHEKLKDSTSQGHSTLNDKFMEHVDLRLEATMKLMREEDNRNRDHIARLFDKIEETRRDTTNALAQHALRSEDRHSELMTALHNGLAKKADK